MVVLPLGIRPDLTLEDREVKRRLGKCCPQAYSDLIKSNLPGSSGVSPSSSLHSKSPPLPAMETSPFCCEANSGRTSSPCRAIGEEEKEHEVQGSGSS